MSELRKDPLSDRWVIVSPARQARPHDTVPGVESRACPFCAGHENATPETVVEYRLSPSDLTWQVRVVPNKYPVVVPEFARSAPMTGWQWETGGLHEVVIESPRHLESLSELTEPEVELAFHAYAARLRQLRADQRLAYAAVFKNCRAAAGASLRHLHSQILAASRVPDRIVRDLDRLRSHAATHGSCLVCEWIEAELAEGSRVVETTPDLLVICPYASRFAYEMWIGPRSHRAVFEYGPDQLLDEVARLLHRAIRRLERLFVRPAYNFTLHTSPFACDGADHDHWHIQLFPRIAIMAGFEMASEWFVNSVAPEEAARQLRDA